MEASRKVLCTEALAADSSVEPCLGLYDWRGTRVGVAGVEGGGWQQIMKPDSEGFCSEAGEFGFRAVVVGSQEKHVRHEIAWPGFFILLLGRQGNVEADGLEWRELESGVPLGGS